MPPLRVLYLFHVPEMSGAEFSVMSTLTRLQHEGLVEPYLACPGPGYLAEQFLERTGKPPLIVPIRFRQPLRSPAVFWRTLGRLKRYAQEHQIALLHANSFQSLYYGAPVARWLSLPVIQHVHAISAKRLVRQVRAATMLALADQLIAVSQSVASHFRFFPGGRRIEIIYNGTDAAFFKPRRPAAAVRSELGIAAEAPLIGLFATMLPHKGHHVLIEATARLMQEFPTLRVIHVGGAVASEDRNCTEQFKALVASFGLERQVIFTGFRRDAADLMAALDILVHPPIEPEPFGMVLLEAGMLGKPVIASAIGGIPEIVEHGRTGLLVPSGQAGPLAAAIATLLRDRDTAARLGTAAQERVRGHFSLEANARAVYAVYEQMCRSPRRSRDHEAS